MTPTSEERREIAANLRELADGKSPMAECSVYKLADECTSDQIWRAD